jgi:hypothetical protein
VVCRRRVVVSRREAAVEHGSRRGIPAVGAVGVPATLGSFARIDQKRKKKEQYVYRLFGTGSLKEGEMTYPLKARIVEPEGTAVARERLIKHASAAIYARSNRTVGDVFCAVRAEAISRGSTDLRRRGRIPPP